MTPVDYTLVVVGTMLPRSLAQRLGFGPDDATIVDGVWTVDARKPLGLWLVITRSRGRATVDFRAEKTVPAKAWGHVARLVERALETGDEDLTLTAFGRHVVVERVDGVVRRLPGDFTRRDPESIVLDVIGLDVVEAARRIVDAHSDVEVRSAALLLRQAASDPQHPFWAAAGPHALRLAAAIDEQRRGDVPEIAQTPPTPEQLVGALFTDYVYEDVILDERLLESADHEALSWVRSLSPDDVRAATRLLLEVAEDRSHPVVPEFRQEPIFQWHDDEESWAWFGRFARHLVARVEYLLAPGPTPERVAAELFAAHFDSHEVWGATPDQLLFAADAAARDLAEEPAAREVAARLRTLAEDRTDPLILKLELASGFPWITHWDDQWTMLQAVARRIADRIDALVP